LTLPYSGLRKHVSLKQQEHKSGFFSVINVKQGPDTGVTDQHLTACCEARREHFPVLSLPLQANATQDT